MNPIFKKLIQEDEDFNYELENKAIEYCKKNEIFYSEVLIPKTYILSDHSSFLELMERSENIEKVYIKGAKLIKRELELENKPSLLKLLLKESTDGIKDLLAKELKNLPTELREQFSNDYYVDNFKKNIEEVSTNEDYYDYNYEEIVFSGEVVSISEFIEKVKDLDARRTRFSNKIVAFHKSKYLLMMPYVLRYLEDTFTKDEAELLLIRYNKKDGLEKYDLPYLNIN